MNNSLNISVNSTVAIRMDLFVDTILEHTQEVNLLITGGSSTDRPDDGMVGNRCPTGSFCIG